MDSVSFFWIRFYFTTRGRKSHMKVILNFADGAARSTVRRSTSYKQAGLRLRPAFIFLDLRHLPPRAVHAHPNEQCCNF